MPNNQVGENELRPIDNLSHDATEVIFDYLDVSRRAMRSQIPAEGAQAQLESMVRRLAGGGLPNLVPLQAQATVSGDYALWVQQDTQPALFERAVADQDAWRPVFSSVGQFDPEKCYALGEEAVVMDIGERDPWFRALRAFAATVPDAGAPAEPQDATDDFSCETPERPKWLTWSYYSGHAGIRDVLTPMDDDSARRYLGGRFFVVTDGESPPQAGYLPAGTVLRGIERDTDGTASFATVLGFVKAGCNETCWVSQDGVADLGTEYLDSFDVLPEAAAQTWTGTSRTTANDGMWVDRRGEFSAGPVKPVQAFSP
jgi:hypothetical protein